MNSTFRNWRQEVFDELKERFGMDEVECFDDEVLQGCFDNGESPYEVIDWMRSKYDLTEIRVAY